MEWFIWPVFLINQRRGSPGRSCGRTCQSFFESMPTGMEGVFAMNRNLLNSFLSDERGTETVEWGLMAGLIVGALVLTVAAIGSWVNARFTQLNTDLNA